MTELIVEDHEVVKDLPGNPAGKGGPAKVIGITLSDGRTVEMFATATTKLPSKGDKVDPTSLEYNEQWKRWQFKKTAPQNRQGGGRSPADTKAIQRQHSQEMALRREANLGAHWSEDQLRSVINWFEDDITTKDHGVRWDGYSSDVPVDEAGLPPRPADTPTDQNRNPRDAFGNPIPSKPSSPEVGP